MFNLFRSPITEPAEPIGLKTVALWQVPADDKVGMMLNNSGRYIPVSEMECVFSTRMSGTVDSILSECFDRFNETDEKYSVFNYSMSVGDVVEVNRHMYRCLPNGWVEIGCDMDGEPIPVGNGDIDARDVGLD